MTLMFLTLLTVIVIIGVYELIRSPSLNIVQNALTKLKEWLKEIVSK